MSVSASGMVMMGGPSGKVSAMSPAYAPILTKGLEVMINLSVDVWIDD